MFQLWFRKIVDEITLVRGQEHEEYE